MNALVKKEIRLLLPGFLIGVALTFAIGLLKRDQLGFNTFVAVVSIVSCSAIAVFIALNSFGAEINSGTFSMLLAQPVSRHRIWRTKTLLLAAALFIGGFSWCVILYLRFEVSKPPEGIGKYWYTFLGTWLFLLVIYSGALWTVLLLRQMAAAFWVTLLIPGAIVVLIPALWPEKYSAISEQASVAALLIYSVTGFWFARRLFLRAQDVAWTGGTISFSAWRYSEAGSKSFVSTRRRNPIIALLKKEFQLQSISLFCIGALLALHVGVLFLRIYYVNFHRNSWVAGVSDFFWMLWLVVPLVIGCTAVAEERKLGVVEEQFCLPVSRRVQFAIKFILTMILGTTLGGVVPILLETVATHLGAQSESFNPGMWVGNEFNSALIWFQISILALAAGLAAGLAWVSFFASTLARNFLQALGIAIATVLSCFLFVSFITVISHQQETFFGTTPSLPTLIAILVIPATLLWLASLNFKYFYENWRFWRRNLLGVTGALLFVIVSSAAVYNRTWEIVEPAESPHGTPRFSLSNPPRLQGDYTFSPNLLVRLPDGRVWFNSWEDSLESRPNLWKEWWRGLVRPLPKSAGPRQFIGGSIWASVTARHIEFNDFRDGHLPGSVVGYLDTVGIQPDGTLWISSEAKPIIWTGARMIRFGDETNWDRVARSAFDGFLLLKTDGTLWQWGTKRFDLSQWQTNWPSVRGSKPQQIGTDSDWKEMFLGSWSTYARKTDGSIWTIHMDPKTGKDELERKTNLDQIVPQTFSQAGPNSMAYVGKDGVLWVFDRYYDRIKKSLEGTGRFLPVSKETSWVAVAVTWDCIVALKADGSLWKWGSEDSASELAKIPPTRLGIHSDWVGLTSTPLGAVSMAADGSLWFWPNTGHTWGTLLKPPKQPQSLGNIFSDAH